MVHGTLDLTVPYVNARAVIAQADKVGLMNTLITIPGAKHVPFHELFTEIPAGLDDISCQGNGSNTGTVSCEPRTSMKKLTL